MRDAFGGAFMIKIFIVFIFVYICLTAMALNYAKAFKVKNEIITYLEENEIIDVCNMNVEEIKTMEDFFENELVGKRGYNVSEHGTCKNNVSGPKYDNPDNPNECTGYCYQSGIDIDITGKAENTEGIYYTVSTYMNWGIPFLNNLLKLNGNNEEKEVATGLWTISGQTRLIVRDN